MTSVAVSVVQVLADFFFCIGSQRIHTSDSRLHFSSFFSLLLALSESISRLFLVYSGGGLQLKKSDTLLPFSSVTLRQSLSPFLFFSLVSESIAKYVIFLVPNESRGRFPTSPTQASCAIHLSFLCFSKKEGLIQQTQGVLGGLLYSISQLRRLSRGLTLSQLGYPTRIH